MKFLLTRNWHLICDMRNTHKNKAENYTRLAIQEVH